ncbi:glycoside hydrolase family 9 protein [Paenibacillus sp. TRM 82003]|nr:glycoside hydrolase family 9 protein [Paenibacillus sp. TRM 82003]
MTNQQEIRQNDEVYLNQIGYRSDAAKHAVVRGAVTGCDIVDSASGERVYRIESGGVVEMDAATGDTWTVFDFSDFRKPGAYKLVTEGTAPSMPFLVNEAPYGEVKDALLKSFYYQRCGIALEETYAGVWKHGACHEAEGVVYGTDERRPSAGGWHDAGDYGKYVVAAAKAVADLMLAYESFPDAWREPLGIPESGNGVPDVLNETRFEIEWLFLTQRQDGAVFHKLTTHRFPGLDVMPEDDRAELVFSPVSYAAAGTLAASMAMASRVYRPFDSAFADRCLEAAANAWTWLEGTEPSGFRNPPDVTTGEYGDAIVEDERYWAAAELFRTTGAAAYLEAAIEASKRGTFPLHPLGWADVGGYGTLALLLCGADRIGTDAYERLRSVWLSEAERLAMRSGQDPFGCSLMPDGYIWGSNMNVMNHAMTLAFATTRFGGPDYSDAIARHWDYLLGCNATGYCYVTGFGAKRVLHPHHRPSVGDGVEAPVPGMVAGGPNAGRQDEAAAALLQGEAPACCFIDHVDSYSTNEMTIYWNSPAVFIAAYMESTSSRS